jgi:ribosomal protein S12 methylthiotransferase
VGTKQYAGRAAVVTLGCAKNQVDSEVMVGVLRSTGFEIVNELAHADVVVINTCGFLESAVKESIDCVLEVAQLKRSGSLRKLIVAGCMVERYRGDIKKTLPEVDAFIAVDDLLSVGKAATEGNETVQLLESAARPYFLYDDTMPRHLSTRSHTAYVKISEGCNRPCAFCIIPKIRGAMRSRSIDSVVREVEALGKQGVREINLVAQDLTDFGSDTGEGNIAQLLRALDKSAAVEWIRLLYAYPVGVTDDLLAAIEELPRVVKYLDVPLQHASERVLKSMKRPVGRFGSRRLVEYIRERAPSVHIRTTFIVGFPGETDEDVLDLENLVLEGHFSNVGVFTYSREDGTPAGEMPNQIAESVKRDRRNRVMAAQQGIVAARNAAMIGKTIPVLIEGPHEDSDLVLAGRASFQAPEVDGLVIVNDIEGLLPEDIVPGSIHPAVITEAAGYDLVARIEA